MMIASMVTTITLILLFFVIWRMTSRSFRERCERPKFLFLESLGVPSAIHPHPLHQILAQENTDEPHHS
jgi:hypothetical protein